jgi:hypothetical protein
LERVVRQEREGARAETMKALDAGTAAATEPSGGLLIIS